MCHGIQNQKGIFQKDLHLQEELKIIFMLKKFTLTDTLLFVSAFLSLIYSEILFFNGNANQAIFIGLWVPSILSFGIYLKLINKEKND